MAPNAMKKICQALLLVPLLSLLAQAQWSTDPGNNLIVGYGLLPEICWDGTGGVYVSFEIHTVYPRQVALQRLNRYGYLPWGEPQTLQGIFPETRYAKLTTDRHNGIIVAFDDDQMISAFPPRYDTRVRAQRVDSAGTFPWGPAGVRVLRMLAQAQPSSRRAFAAAGTVRAARRAAGWPSRPRHHRPAADVR